MWKAYTGVTQCVFDQIPNLQKCFTTLNKNLGMEGGLRQIQVNFLEKPTFKLESFSYFVHGLHFGVS